MTGDWISETTSGGATRFGVRQRKHVPMIVLGIIVAVILGLLMLAKLLDGAPLLSLSLQSGKAFASSMAKLAAAFLCVIAVVDALLYGLPSLFRKGRAEFSVSADGLELHLKNKSSYPSTIARNDIARLFRTNALSEDRKETIVVTITDNSLAGSMRQAGQAVDNVTRGVADLLMLPMAAYAYDVGINARGREVLLARDLSECEAEFLMARIEHALQQRT
jgi:hypothetical protein